MFVSSSELAALTAMSPFEYDACFLDKDGLPLDSFSWRKSMLDSKYVLAGRGRELLDFVLVTGSRISLLGLLPSSEGRKDDRCLV